jgi:xylulokinase
MPRAGDAVPDLHRIAGNLVMPGFTAPKLLWLRRHEPAVFARTAHVLLPKAWMRYRLTGEMIEEMSDASDTLWLDVGRRDWSDTLLAATGLDRAAMPRLVEGNAPAGTLRPGPAGGDSGGARAIERPVSSLSFRRAHAA